MIKSIYRFGGMPLPQRFQIRGILFIQKKENKGFLAKNRIYQYRGKIKSLKKTDSDLTTICQVVFSMADCQLIILKYSTTGVSL